MRFRFLIVLLSAYFGHKLVLLNVFYADLIIEIMFELGYVQLETYPKIRSNIFH